MKRRAESLLDSLSLRRAARDSRLVSAQNSVSIMDASQPLSWRQSIGTENSQMPDVRKLPWTRGRVLPRSPELWVCDTSTVSSSYESSNCRTQKYRLLTVQHLTEDNQGISEGFYGINSSNVTVIVQSLYGCNVEFC